MRKISLHTFSTECKCPVLVVRNCNNFTNLPSLFWYEPSNVRSLKFLLNQPLWMRDQEFFPEHRERSEYLSLLDFMRFDEEKVLIRVKFNFSLITDLENSIISSFPSRRIGSIQEYGVDRMLHYQFLHYIFWNSLVYRKSSSDLLELEIDRLEYFADESETWIILTKILYRTSIMDKYRKYFFRVFYSLYESSIIVKSEILTKDEKGTVVQYDHGAIIEKNEKRYTFIFRYSDFLDIPFFCDHARCGYIIFSYNQNFFPYSRGRDLLACFSPLLKKEDFIEYSS